MHQLTRSSHFVTDLVNEGLLSAIAKYRIKTPFPLDPVENWQFWTKPKPAWLEQFAKNYPPESRRRAYVNQLLEQDHAIGIEDHYDISNEFYALFLDKKYRFYTCAEFLSEEETLEQAQINKAKYLHRLLNLRGDEKMLDLGCGWGAMLKFLRDSGHEGELTGLTLSQEQFAYIQQELGLNVQLKNFITDSFEHESYDRIFSIGALEHVRPAELTTIYRKIYDALTPGGLAVHQFFSFEHQSYPGSSIILQQFFPGSMLVLHHEHLEAAKRAGFQITHDSLGDYKPTLRAWYERLAANREQALSLVGLEIYNRYMTFFPIAWLFFQHEEANLHRIVMEKPA